MNYTANGLVDDQVPASSTNSASSEPPPFVGDGRRQKLRTTSSQVTVAAISEASGITATSSAALPDAITGNWGLVSKAGLSQRMFGKLVRTVSASERLSASARLLVPTSVARFLEFWTLVRDVANEPELALAPDGSLYAEWYKSKNERLDIRFTAKKAFFGVLSKTNILEGADGLDAVASLLKYHPASPLEWKGI